MPFKLWQEEVECKCLHWAWWVPVGRAGWLYIDCIYIHTIIIIKKGMHCILAYKVFAVNSNDQYMYHYILLQGQVTHQNEIQLLYCHSSHLPCDSAWNRYSKSRWISLCNWKIYCTGMYNTLPLHNRQLSTTGAVQSKSILHIKRLLKAF